MWPAHWLLLHGLWCCKSWPLDLRKVEKGPFSEATCAKRLKSRFSMILSLSFRCCKNQRHTNLQNGYKCTLGCIWSSFTCLRDGRPLRITTLWWVYYPCLVPRSSNFSKTESFSSYRTSKASCKWSGPGPLQYRNCRQTSKKSRNFTNKSRTLPCLSSGATSRFVSSISDVMVIFLELMTS